MHTLPFVPVLMFPLLLTNLIPPLLLVFTEYGMGRALQYLDFAAEQHTYVFQIDIQYLCNYNSSVHTPA